MDHAQGRDRKLWHCRLDGVTKERECIPEDRMLELHRCYDMRGWGRPFVGLLVVVERDPDRVVLNLLDPAKLIYEVHVPGFAALLSIGRRPQPDLLLHPNHHADGVVLDVAKLAGDDPSRGEVVSGPQHVPGTQQAADVIGAEWRAAARRRRARRVGCGLPDAVPVCHADRLLTRTCSSIAALYGRARHGG